MRELPSDAVITSSPATLSVMPELVPGIVTGASAPIGAVNVFGAEFAVKGSVVGQPVHPLKLNVMSPLSEYETVEPLSVGVYLTDTGRGPFGVLRLAGSYVSATSVASLTCAVSVPWKATAPRKRQKPTSKRHGGFATPVSALTGTLVLKPRLACFVIVTGSGLACAGVASTSKKTDSATPSWTKNRDFPTMPSLSPPRDSRFGGCAKRFHQQAADTSLSRVTQGHPDE